MPGKQGPQPNAEITAQILALFVQHGARPDTRDKRGRTPLHQACKSNNIKAVEYLLSSPDVSQFDSQINAQTSGGETSP